ncbi:MAG: RNA polymerase sigma factor [Nannocystaceae bacterium]
MTHDGSLGEKRKSAQKRSHARDLRWVEDAYKAHYAYIYRVLGRLGVNPTQVEDALQDVFIVLHRRRASFEGRSSLQTWLYGIALRVARRYRERSERLRQREAPPPLREPACDEPSLEQATENRQALAVLDRILNAMEGNRREVFVLYEIEGLLASEISELLEVNRNTVYSRLRLARRDFSRALSRLQKKPHGGPRHG